jgi:hypothetical protein
VAKSIFVTDNDDALARRYAHTSEGPYHFYFKQLIRKLVGFGGRSNLFKLDQSEPDDAINADTITPRLVRHSIVRDKVELEFPSGPESRLRQEGSSSSGASAPTPARTSSPAASSTSSPAPAPRRLVPAGPVGVGTSSLTLSPIGVKATDANEGKDDEP